MTSLTADVEKWEKLSSEEWALLPMETIDQVSFKMIEAGKTPRIVSNPFSDLPFSDLPFSDLPRPSLTFSDLL